MADTGSRTRDERSPASVGSLAMAILSRAARHRLAAAALTLTLSYAGQRPQAVQNSAEFNRMVRQQAETDRTWRMASAGFMRMDKIVFRSGAGDLDIPACVFRPLISRGPKTQPALVCVHENTRGHLYEHYIPYIRSAIARGYVVIAPEYRGSIGYGKALYDAIDYGGTAVD